MTPQERFATKVNAHGPIPEQHPEAGPCHLWTASRFASGYGQFGVPSDDGRWMNVRAHRWWWQQHHGQLAPDVVLDHWACSRPICVNPAHLRPVSQRENVLRSETSVAAVNRAKDHCPAGHPYSGDNLLVRETDNARMCRACRLERDRAEKRAIRARMKAAGLTSRGTVPKRGRATC